MFDEGDSDEELDFKPPPPKPAAKEAPAKKKKPAFDDDDDDSDDFSFQPKTAAKKPAAPAKK